MPLNKLGNCASAPVDGRQTLRKISNIDQRNPDAVNLTLFRNAKHQACGWFIGPLGYHESRLVLPLLPKDKETMASLAVVRAIEAAKASNYPLCLIDPENLWDTIWN